MSRSSPKAAPASRRAAARSVGRRSRLADRAHALAAAAGRGLDEQRVADSLGRPDERLVRLVRVVVAGRDRDAEARGELAGGRLVAHRPDGGRWGADPADPGCDHALGEVGVLGEEAEARVERVRVRAAGGRDHGVGIEQVEGLRPVRRRGDRADAEPVAGPCDPGGDLAAVRDEQHVGWDGRASRFDRRHRALERANRVRRDTPATTDTPRGQSPHSRSSAGRTVWTSQAAVRPRSGSVRRSSCRDCRTLSAVRVDRRAASDRPMLRSGWLA